ncbi:3'-5'-exoribonuclease family protein [Prunus dulcis]|uniref:3'-5'-exoribonuclease family protein n=1 Tax=Prunus dulcis TaxID=3755 RepID=A0A5H2XK43_PRUDU|nr:3'-5'-exoribonuclease family protein [Prunus dulcis]
MEFQEMEYVSPEGLRLDGRRPMEMRQIRAEIGVVAKADGSALFEMGNTKVIAAVYGPREVQNRSQQLNDSALVRCEYTMANFSTGDRMRKPKGDRRSTEISLVIRQTMEACIMTHLMPRSQIDIFVQVLQADGGTRSACINAASLALADAGIPMRDLVTSCSAGYLNSTPLLDLNYIEDSAGGADVTLGILPKLDKVTLLQMDAKLSVETFENVMQLAIEGCKAVATYIRERIQSNWSIAEASKFQIKVSGCSVMRFEGGYITRTVLMEVILELNPLS